METITLRNINPELKKALIDKAERDSASLNSVALQALGEAFGLQNGPRRKRNPELEKLAGTWSEKDKEEFEKNTSSFNKVDDDLWL
ncbi:MAG: hypothetical protein L3J39_03985 [Verrucomicrobiales bacterium]|nr:hypothetical protein [Verrucomicrobiales bacterium]